MNRQRAQKEWTIKARVKRVTAVKCTQYYLMCAQLTTLSPSPISLLGLIAVQPGLYLGLCRAVVSCHPLPLVNCNDRMGVD